MNALGRSSTRSVCSLICLIAAHSGLAQQPVITAVENGASHVPAASSGGVAPQMVVSIKGQNLSTSAPATASYPWPKRLAGSTVLFNGTEAALSYVSNSQINAVAPSALSGSLTASIVVTTAAGSSAPATVSVIQSSLGIFTQDTSGCGQAVALNVHADGSTSLNTPQNSLDPQSDWGLTLFFTGLGVFPDRVDGVPWPYNPNDNLAQTGDAATFGIPGLGRYNTTLETTYLGPAPAQAAVDQTNAGIANNSRAYIPEGCRVPLYLNWDWSASQIVNVSIHSGGGACVDPGDNTLGIVTWGQNVVSDAGGISTSSSITAQFLKGNSITFPPGPGPGFGEGAVQAQPSLCANAYPTTLNAGALTISGAAGPTTLQSQNQNGILTYQTSLAVTPGGTSSISATGASSGVGPFNATADIPPPITITTNLQPGTSINGPYVNAPFTLNWSGGDNRSAVTVELIHTNHVPAPPGSPSLFDTELGGTGSATLMPFPNLFLKRTAPQDTASPSPNGIEIIVTQQPATSPSLPFTAPGLTLGGEQIWKYVWDFRGLVEQ